MIRRLLALVLVFLLVASLSEARLIYQGGDPRYIALTFDDGPSIEFTQLVLDVLKKEKVQATFFVIGKKVKENPWLLQRVAKGGHEIGNHTFSHSKLTWINDVKTIKEIRETSVLVSFYTRQKVKYFRPPHGTITKSKRRLIEQRGYDVVLWSVNADDFWHTGRGIRSPESIARRVLARVCGGDIILMHDNSWQMAEALPEIIRDLKERGYEFVTMSEFMKKQKEYRLAKRHKYAE
ncbi:MAG: polysaccharide deacetylase family protein [Candidatus Margulisiibacteriota bacterium]